jgi:uncharacterized protein (DUF433 family)
MADMSEPTAAEPWTVTIGYSPDQNGGRPCVMPRRVPIHAIVGLIRGGEDTQAVADEFGLTVEQVGMIEILMVEALRWET